MVDAGTAELPQQEVPEHSSIVANVSLLRRLITNSSWSKALHIICNSRGPPALAHSLATQKGAERAFEAVAADACNAKFSQEI